MPGSVKIRFNRIPDLTRKLREGAAQVVDDTANTVLAVMTGLAPVDTGALQVGFYIISANDSGYADAVERAQSLNPNAPILDEVDPPETDTGRFISNVVGYQPFQELGTARMDAQPHMTPAAEGQRGAFIAAMTEILGHE